MTPSEPRKIIVAVVACVSFIVLLVVANLDVKGSDIDSPSSSDASTVYANYLSTDDSFYAAANIAADEALASASKPKTTTDNDPITAEAYFAGDLETGRIYLEKNSSRRLPFASMSKLITAIAAVDRHELSTVTEISLEASAMPPDSSNLKVGERFTIGELLYPTLISSSNVAAEAIASASGVRDDFLDSMSAYAWELGMPDTLFAEPTGLSPQNAGTAKDLFALSRYLYDQREDILEITRISSMQIEETADHGAHQVVSTHPFVDDPRFIGGKTGRTPEALETMLTMIQIQGRPVSVIVLRSNWARAMDTTLIIERVADIIKKESL